MKQAIVIGSGIGGAAIGSLLAASGQYTVTLLEKNTVTGGRFHTFTRDGFHVDMGCHAIVNCDKGNIGTVLRRAGQADAVAWSYTTRPGPTYIYEGQPLKFPSHINSLGVSPDETEQVVQVYRDVVAMEERDFEFLDSVPLPSFLKGYITDERILSFFSYLASIYFCIDFAATPAGEWARCQKEVLLNRATGYPLGGTGVITDALLRAITQHGGSVLTAMPVERILIEKETAVGVRLQNGDVLRADLVISNCGIKSTVLELAGESHYTPDFVARVKAYSWADSSFTVRVALAKPVTDEKLLFYIGRRDLERAVNEMRSGVLPRRAAAMMIPVVSNLDPSAAPSGRQLIFAGTSCWSDPASPESHWEQWHDMMIGTLEEIFPGLNNHILWTDYSHPGTIASLFGEKGAIIGIGQRLGQVGPNRPPVIDPAIKNLYHCCADTGKHGIGGELAADSALTLMHILDNEP